MILQFAKLPPPIGGVTIHVKRLIASLQAINTVDVDILDYSKDRNFLKVIGKILKANIVHLHLTRKKHRLFFVILFKILLKKVVITFHGNYDFKNMMDKYSLKFSDAAILLNNMSYVSACKIRKCNNHLVGAFIPPLEQDVAPLNALLTEKIYQFKSNYSKVFSTNAFDFALDPNGREIYMGSDLINFFKDQQDYGLIFSDPTGNYYKFLKLNFDDLPANVFFITVPHDFINIIRISDGLIRATITDGDSLSIKEGLFYNKVVYATGVVDRPKEVLVFNNFDELQNLISNNIKNGTHSDVKNNFDDILKVYLELQE
tara:strand:- start:3532 stop:4479 length:948 start_codon:yes stop_codon:yes gene_type:complete